MKFVVTGGAGFVGSHLSKFLLEQGHEIKIIDNLYRGKIENLDEVRNDLEFLQLDILDYDNIKNEFKGMDGVFHQAALTVVPESYKKEAEYKKVNIDGTENIFKIASEFDIKVVFASSSSVYGNPTMVPISEDFDRKPINPYGVTKVEDENLALKYSNSGTKIIGLRYFNVYGRGQTPEYAGVITKFLERITANQSPIIFGDGSQVRDFVYVRDVARANLIAMTSNITNGFFNIGNGIATSILELATILIRLSKKSLEPEYDKLPEGDIKSSQANIDLAKKLLGWQPEYTLESGLSTFFT